jgi:dTMP kinase
VNPNQTESFTPSGLRGRFVTLEGIDGAGKSTHLDSIASRWRALGAEVVQTREPGGTPLAEALRELVLHRSMDPLTEVLLIFAARRDHLRQVIEPALARGATVLCDRFTDASFAYQGAGRGFDETILRTLEQWVQAGEGGHVRQPDLTFWFDLDPAVAARRVAAARHADRFEQQELAFFERVAAGYARRCGEHGARFARIDASRAREDVAAQIVDVLNQRGW